MKTENMTEIIADPTALAELQKCTSVNELVARLNQAGAECTREEGLRFLRTWENMAADDEPMDLDEMDQVAGGTGGGFIDYVKAFFRRDASLKRRVMSTNVQSNPLTIETILNKMNV